MSRVTNSLIRLTFFVTSIVLMSACVSTKTVSVSEETSNKFNGKSISATQRVTPSFAAITAGKAVFGGIGAAAMVSAGNKIVAENAVEDPADYIASTLLQDLVAKYQVKAVNSKVGVLSSEKPAAIIKQHTGSELILDVRTTNWNFTYFPTDWNNYRVIYAAKLRLLDSASGSVIAEGFCSRVPEQSKQAPTLDELLADQAYMLKAELRLAANKCINDFRVLVFNLPDAPLAELAPVAVVPDNRNTGLDNSLTKTGTENTAHPDLLAALQSNSSTEMRRAAIEIGQKKLYNDEGLFQASIQLMQSADSRDFESNAKVLIDGLSWVAFNLGNSKDERARSALSTVADNLELPKKLRNHAIHSLKTLDSAATN